MGPDDGTASGGRGSRRGKGCISRRHKGEHANPWGSLHYRCGRLVTVRRVEAGIPRAEGSLEHAVLHGIAMNPTGLHALLVNSPFDHLKALPLCQGPPGFAAQTWRMTMRMKALLPLIPLVGVLSSGS